LDALPEANPGLRIELQKELETNGIAHLYNKLQIMDPEGSLTIDAQNPHRVMRAIELISSTGLSLSQLKTKPSIQRPFKIVKIVMDSDRNTIYERINQRVDAMVDEGLVNEAKSVYHLRHLNALNTVGYSELFDYFDGKYSLAEAIDKIKQHTRNYAKRQLTWLRNESDTIPQSQFKHEMLLKSH
jgi:tRNA dimethylallyltransferase